MQFSGLILGIIVLDQLAKSYIQGSMQLGMSIPVVPDIFHITYILNAGAAFGILENQRWLFIVIAVLMIVAMVYCYPKIKLEHRILQVGVALLTGGAIGNLIDRLQTGQVVDFFDLRVWPIFNIADIAIVVGISLIIFALFFLAESKKEVGNKDE